MNNNADNILLPMFSLMLFVWQFNHLSELILIILRSSFRTIKIRETHATVTLNVSINGGAVANTVGGGSAISTTLTKNSRHRCKRCYQDDDQCARPCDVVARTASLVDKVDTTRRPALTINKKCDKLSACDAMSRKILLTM